MRCVAVVPLFDDFAHQWFGGCSLLTRLFRKLDDLRDLDGIVLLTTGSGAVCLDDHPACARECRIQAGDSGLDGDSGLPAVLRSFAASLEPEGDDVCCLAVDPLFPFLAGGRMEACVQEVIYGGRDSAFTVRGGCFAARDGFPRLLCGCDVLAGGAMAAKKSMLLSSVHDCVGNHAAVVVDELESLSCRSPLGRGMACALHYYFE